MGFMKTPKEYEMERQMKREYGIDASDEQITKDKTWLDSFFQYLKESKERDRQKMSGVV